MIKKKKRKKISISCIKSVISLDILFTTILVRILKRHENVLFHLLSLTKLMGSHDLLRSTVTKSHSINKIRIRHLSANGRWTVVVVVRNLRYRHLQWPSGGKVTGVMQELLTPQPGGRRLFSCPILTKFGTNNLNSMLLWKLLLVFKILEFRGIHNTRRPKKSIHCLINNQWNKRLFSKFLSF